MTKTVTIGFLGYGNIGTGVWELLSGFTEEMAHRHGLTIEVKRILVRDVNKKRRIPQVTGLLTDDPDAVLLDPDISLVIECLGGEEPATAYMLKALSQGKTVVTANKLAVALHWPKLQQAAEENGAGLYYEASVCGAIPIIETINKSLQANRIDTVMGIINGTTNYILSRMSQNGEAYDDVLRDAQALGLAEPDPSSDVEGMDAAYKLSILSSLSFHAKVPYERIFRQGITKVSPLDIACGQEMGYALKLLAIAKRRGNTIETRVHPTFIPKEHPLASVNGSFNAVYLHGHAFDAMTLQGRGAGDLPTASAIVSDVIRAATCQRHFHPTFVNSESPDASLTFTDNWECAYFIRLSAVDAPGVLSHVSGCFAKHQVSIASMIQKGTQEEGRVPLIFITHEAKEQSMLRALADLDEKVATVESMIRVEG